tara:strand:+ start:8489 stop:8638 length:150 start_codon:yes stop_codon:yes gene_type:complete
VPNAGSTEKRVPEMLVSYDGQDHLPVTEAELELYEEHLLNILSDMVQDD